MYRNLIWLICLILFVSTRPINGGETLTLNRQEVTRLISDQIHIDDPNKITAILDRIIGNKDWEPYGFVLPDNGIRVDVMKNEMTAGTFWIHDQSIYCFHQDRYEIRRISAVQKSQVVALLGVAGKAKIAPGVSDHNHSVQLEESSPGSIKTEVSKDVTLDFLMDDNAAPNTLNLDNLGGGTINNVPNRQLEVKPQLNNDGNFDLHLDDIDHIEKK